MRIALVVDNPLRDLPGLVLVASHLVNAGGTVYLVPMNLQQWEVFSLAPDYVLVNYCRKNNEKLLGRMLTAGIRVGVLDTEGGVLASMDSYAQSLASDIEVRSSITSFMTWGPVLGDYAVQSGWFSRDQVAITGSPRYDFYQDTWRPAALEFTDVPGDESKPLVLFNGNFPLANPQFYTPEEEARQLIEGFGYSAEDVGKWQSVQRNTMIGLTTLANELAERFPDVRFVYRPHPFEGLKTYENLLVPRPNLQFLRDGTVAGWILRSAAVIQRGCSTAIEAAMGGTISLSPSWIPTAEEIDIVNAVSYSCRSTDEMAATLKQVLAGNFSPHPSERETLARIVGDWFTAIDGKAAERVAQTILGGMPRTRDQSLEKRCERALYGLDAAVRQHVVGSTRRLLGISPEFSFRPWDNKRSDWAGSIKAFGSAEVERIANAVMSAAPRGSMRPIRVVPAAQASSARPGYAVRSVALLAEKDA
ncbi:MAG TPA: surface carbohydrate biosynthesis protein [Gemmatimonadaceae bacterium]|nr:surface carbohydrate biosynthesis protein [Gemmatimonadaceae bacterium]